MTTAWFHPFSGIAGDMAFGALVDAGAELDAVVEILGALGLDGWRVEAEPVLRGGIAGTKIHVHVAPTSVVRTAASIDALVAAAPLPDRVRDRARLVFAALAAAEGHLHRSEPAQVHFHEVGGTDAIIDVVGTCAALEVLDVDRVVCATVVTGTGMVRAAHGIIPNPAPATVQLLSGAPTRGIDVAVELTTPTGAAILAALVEQWGPMPEMTVTAHGFGAGTRELDGRPNLTQVVIGTPDSATLDPGQPVILLETNVDDVTGEVLAHAVAALLDAGAHDAWLTPVMMKKGRPGYIVHALADLAVADEVRRTLVGETGSFGVRGQRLERWPEARHGDEVDTPDGIAHVKVSRARAKVEFDDAARIAQARHAPLRAVIAELEAAWRRNADPDIVPVHAHTHGDHSHEAHDHGHNHPHDHPHDHTSDWTEEGPSDPVA
ncbi:MAG: nickel pincer cofactor biosynthesis protein LarC [Actinobacteria bacterium]|nr:nickel pincer cofactor biosynthesis protein LarC [Actinomycetota bacterium]